jgi:catechol 2,3-dioxygenase
LYFAAGAIIFEMANDYGVRPPNYRLPDSAHIGCVRLQVSDLARSLEYYERVIGMRVLHRDRNLAVLGPHDDDRPLIELHERPGVSPVPRHARFGLYHFAILVPHRTDLGRFLAHLSQERVRVASADHLVSEALYLWDPDGLGIEVYADRPRSQWQVNGREVAMTTDPLDMRSLIEAAAGTTWSGMPKGTVIGHVHLHVGSLARAEATYHAGLGLDKMVWSYPGALFFSAGGYHHHLGTNTWVESGKPAGENEARLLEWELVLPTFDDVEQVAASLTASGHEVSGRDGDRLVHDDWGTALRLRSGQAA